MRSCPPSLALACLRTNQQQPSLVLRLKFPYEVVDIIILDPSKASTHAKREPQLQRSGYGRGPLGALVMMERRHSGCGEGGRQTRRGAAVAVATGAADVAVGCALRGGALRDGGRRVELVFQDVGQFVAPIEMKTFEPGWSLEERLDSFSNPVMVVDLFSVPELMKGDASM